MAVKILITGGAGFVGSHLADELLAHGYAVRVLDPLVPQVHGPVAVRPAHLSNEVEFFRGDLRNPVAVQAALEGVEAVYHLAANVGVGQSMYQIEEYTSINGVGSAVLLEAMARRSISRLVVASSMSVYGEGLYRGRSTGRDLSVEERSLGQLQAHDWELRGADGEPLSPIPTPESKCPALASVYALSKFYQERLCLIVGRAYGIPTVALRFFNIYGPRQALSNPYTGVLAIFAARFLNHQRPLINEDGAQQRDFVSVHDVVRACRLALEVPEAADKVFNIGSGSHLEIRELARQMGQALGKPEIEAEITGRYRMGDIRHCFADITLAREVLGYRPEVSLADGLQELAHWLEGQTAIDRVAEASQELLVRGLTV